MSEPSTVSPIERLLRVMELLRHETHGCPWDLKQDMKSLTRYTLEEVYEVVDAIENDTHAKICDELGDLLFQIVFYAQLAREADEFDFNDVVAGITDKLLRRHPHVFPDADIDRFGQVQTLDSDEVLNNWEAIKAVERAQKAVPNDTEAPSSLLDDVPDSLPALMRAQKLQNRAASAGFDWPTLNPVLRKLEEETGELKDAIEQGSSDDIVDEFGDVLFTLVNIGRHLKIDPETALRQANGKFESRFRLIEQELEASGQTVGTTGLEELDALWEKVKRRK